jgi:putative ABC transport system permease protein
MLHNYLTVAWRSLLKKKASSFINITGLAMGMAACLLILQYVMFEKSYDSFHQKGKHIYRVSMQHTSSDGKAHHFAPNFAPAAPAIKETYPEVHDFARIQFWDNVLLAYNQRSFLEKKVAFADASFLTLFTYSLAKGEAKDALAKPRTVVLTETMVSKYFGKEDAMGKILLLKTKTEIIPVTVTGVLKDIPLNSHLQFDILVSFKTFSGEIEREVEQNWGWNDFHSYILLSPQADYKRVEAKLFALLEKQKGEYFKNAGVREDFFLTPVADIHLHSDLDGEASVNGDARLVNFLLIIAFFIITIAWINYINLSTAKAMERAKEVGVRKVTGASRLQLMWQFMVESFLLNLISTALALTIMQFSFPLFNWLVGKQIPMLIWQDARVLLVLAGLFIAGVFAAGLYPALVLSSFQPIATLKGRFVSTGHGAFLRKSLVVFQFTASVALIAGTFTVYQQLQYMRNADLGVNIEETLVIRAPMLADSTYASKLQTLRTEIARSPAVKSISATEFVPGAGGISGWGGYIRRVESNPTDVKGYRIAGIDEVFIPTFELKLLAGRNFSKDRPTDREKVILTEEAARQLGFSSANEAIGQNIYYPIEWKQDNRPVEVIGVVNDFHFQSLKNALSPVIFHLEPASRSYYACKIGTADIESTIANAKKQYESLFPDSPFEYFFADEYFNRHYESEMQFGRVFGLFAIIAIMVACLGLFGLASYTILNRTKEIGVRKVLGASVSSILFLLSKDFIRLVLLANLIAWPVAYWAMQAWLANYKFSMGISPWLFLLPSSLVLLIALLTVSVQTLKTARANPAKALKYE